MYSDFEDGIFYDLEAVLTLALNQTVADNYASFQVLNITVPKLIAHVLHKPFVDHNFINLHNENISKLFRKYLLIEYPEVAKVLEKLELALQDRKNLSEKQIFKLVARNLNPLRVKYGSYLLMIPLPKHEIKHFKGGDQEISLDNFFTMFLRGDILSGGDITTFLEDDPENPEDDE